MTYNKALKKIFSFKNGKPNVSRIHSKPSSWITEESARRRRKLRWFVKRKPKSWKVWQHAGAFSWITWRQPIDLKPTVFTSSQRPLWGISQSPLERAIAPWTFAAINESAGPEARFRSGRRPRVRSHAGKTFAISKFIQRRLVARKKFAAFANFQL